MAVVRTLLLLALALAVVGVVADEFDDHGEVQVLTNDNFDAAVAADLMLVEFYAPWCGRWRDIIVDASSFVSFFSADTHRNSFGVSFSLSLFSLPHKTGHCKALAPEFKAAAETLLENDPPIALGMLDATVHGETSGKFEVSDHFTFTFFHSPLFFHSLVLLMFAPNSSFQVSRTLYFFVSFSFRQVSGYPTLKIFRKGKATAYSGPRKADGIVSYMKVSMNDVVFFFFLTPTHATNFPSLFLFLSLSLFSFVSVAPSRTGRAHSYLRERG
jgi:hypothetical protein